MDITIKINTDNAAFEENEPQEVSKILQQAIKLYTQGCLSPYTPLRDTNGNTCGWLYIK